MAGEAIFRFLHSENFNILFSFLVGAGRFALFTPICKGKECQIQKAPSVEEVKGTTYQIGTKCYQFSSTSVDCPKEGVIEPFQRRA